MDSRYIWKVLSDNTVSCLSCFFFYHLPNLLLVHLYTNCKLQSLPVHFLGELVSKYWFVGNLRRACQCNVDGDRYHKALMTYTISLNTEHNTTRYLKKICFCQIFYKLFETVLQSFIIYYLTLFITKKVVYSFAYTNHNHGKYCLNPKCIGGVLPM